MTLLINTKGEASGFSRSWHVGVVPGDSRECSVDALGILVLAGFNSSGPAAVPRQETPPHCEEGSQRRENKGQT